MAGLDEILGIKEYHTELYVVGNKKASQGGACVNKSTFCLGNKCTGIYVDWFHIAFNSFTKSLF